MRKRGVLWMALLVGGLIVPACRDYRVEQVAPLPPRVEVQAPQGPAVAVTDMVKRPLAAGELAQFERAGSRWDYTVQLADTGTVGIRLEQLENVVQSLTGVTAREVTALQGRVEPGGTTSIKARATLATSDPGQPGNLQGVQTLTFRGQDDRGGAVQFVVRVPLD